VEGERDLERDALVAVPGRGARADRRDRDARRLGDHALGEGRPVGRRSVPEQAQPSDPGDRGGT
jgi:hypothetical protein